ncbi:pyridoxamine 5'-phosphate oxidase [Lacinutrix sp. 5H-3-7-4]|uniref:pyridoxamine 5'-phosphate oxidase n=1 Tax=Lacinutrix sp. (strain 5H-3-7-4) TaxID=983544 RepID=UPI00020A3E6F|nr:pyridoxamine 5'-phosphate oxidase [Lacinutrix sp. 5H-3-7-4]AEH02499.1 Pyridoxine/pyridoxamine 5'-phosphate oxidase [Lacinutrix sp. 5H-3-7-4]
MNKDLSNYRKSYEKGELLLEDTPDNPLNLFEKWFKDIDTNFPDIEANAMTLSTLGLDGFPKNRVVLLKSYNEKGFVFFTNYNSDKGKAILNDSKVCISFFWAEAERQIIIKGNAKKVDKTISDNYFNSRPRGSRLGAVASNQSEPVQSRAILDSTLEVLKNKYNNKPIDRPDYWGGFIIEPIEIEFWQGRANRLHDRILYKQAKNQDWNKNRLAP